MRIDAAPPGPVAGHTAGQRHAACSGRFLIAMFQPWCTDALKQVATVPEAARPRARSACRRTEPGVDQAKADHEVSGALLESSALSPNSRICNASLVRRHLRPIPNLIGRSGFA